MVVPDGHTQSVGFVISRTNVGSHIQLPFASRWATEWAPLFPEHVHVVILYSGIDTLLFFRVTWWNNPPCALHVCSAFWLSIRHVKYVCFIGNTVPTDCVEWSNVHTPKPSSEYVPAKWSDVLVVHHSSNVYGVHSPVCGLISMGS